MITVQLDTAQAHAVQDAVSQRLASIERGEISRREVEVASLYEVERLLLDALDASTL